MSMEAGKILRHYLVDTLENNTADWADVPSLDEILNNFASDDGISFGMINYSKISRPHNGTTKADWQQIINSKSAAAPLLIWHIYFRDPSKTSRQTSSKASNTFIEIITSGLMISSCRI